MKMNLITERDIKKDQPFVYFFVKIPPLSYMGLIMKEANSRIESFEIGDKEFVAYFIRNTPEDYLTENDLEKIKNGF